MNGYVMWEAIHSFFCVFFFAPCKGIQDCLAFQIPPHGSRIPCTEFQSLMVDLDSGLQSLVRFQIPKSIILDSTGNMFPVSGFHEPNFSDCGIRILLQGAILFVDSGSPHN